MKRTKQIAVLLGLAALAGATYWSGAGDMALNKFNDKIAAKSAEAKAGAETATLAPAVTVATVETREFIETVLVTGSLVARDEILVAPEIEGLRVLELKVDEGDRVNKGQVLATLVANSIDAQLAENDAQLARASAAISQAKSQIVEAEARAKEAASAFDRAKPLNKQGWVADSTLDQRQSAAGSTKAQVTVGARRIEAWRKPRKPRSKPGAAILSGGAATWT